MNDTPDVKPLRSILDRLIRRTDPSGVPRNHAGANIGRCQALSPMAPSVRGSGNRSVYSRGVCHLDEFGHRLYNIEDGDEVYISRHSAKAMSSEDDLIFIRATDGNFVVQPDTSSEVSETSDPGAEDARILFSNVMGTSSGFDVRGIVGSVKDGRVVPVPKEDRMLKRLVSPPLLRKTDQPAHLDSFDESDSDNTLAPTVSSGVAVQAVQRTSTCGFRFIEDESSDERRGGPDDLRRNRNHGYDLGVEAPYRACRNLRCISPYTFARRALQGRSQRGSQILGDAHNPRWTHARIRGAMPRRLLLNV